MASASDFDFFIGDWRVEHRRLKERLVGCTDWEVFAGTTSTRKILGGMGNCDDNHLELPIVDPQPSQFFTPPAWTGNVGGAGNGT